MNEVPNLSTQAEAPKSTLKALKPRRFKDPLLDGPALGVPPIPIYA